ncbi:MAG TPA: hypothetical protein VEO01_15860 [Pseudonocardiaceae bacterium]|nr:hypothetical protein [Pseudonocardiaceae bacterium]
MSVGPSELANELKTLRKGRGLQAPRLAEQVGPKLRALCGIGENENAASIREKLTKQIRILASGLPEDLRHVVTIALALQPDVQHQFLRERVQSLAEQQRRDVRTIRRRMDEGFDLLAEIAARPIEDRPHGTARGWYVERFEAILRLDKTSPETYERRRIVSDADGLDVLKPTQTQPRDRSQPDHDLNVEAHFGVTLLGKRKVTESRFAFELALPAPLDIGQKHEYGLIVRVPENQLMEPHYVLFPERRCDEFELRIRFDLDRLPSQIWRVDEVFHRDIDENRPTADLLTIDGVGEVHLSFRNLLPGHGYGAQWTAAQS